MSNADNDLLAAQLLHHFGRKLSPGDSVVPPIVQTAVFDLPGNPSNAPFQYGRFHNPTWSVLEAALDLLERAETVLFPSGMAAIAAVLFSSCRAGSRILLPADGYYTTRVLSEQFLKPLNVQVETRPTARLLEGGFDGFDLVFLETPSNPGLDVCDIAAAAKLAKASGSILAVDNTTMTPLGQRPLELGADIVVCADTKAINGHSDVLMGHVATKRSDIATKIREWRRFSGSIPSPFEAWLVHRGLETLEVRFTRMCSSAAVIAERLASQSAVLSVRYPGLPGDPAHAIALRQMTSFGSVISVTLKDAAAAERLIEECDFIQPSTSFGGVRTCAERRQRWGDNVSDGFVRLSIGLEPAEALWRSLARVINNLN